MSAARNLSVSIFLLFIVGCSAQGLRVLSIDGGGTRGVIPLTMLAELEEAAQKKTSEMFDLIVPNKDNFCGIFVNFLPFKVNKYMNIFKCW